MPEHIVHQVERRLFVKLGFNEISVRERPEVSHTVTFRLDRMPYWCLRAPLQGFSSAFHSLKRHASYPENRYNQETEIRIDYQKSHLEVTKNGGVIYSFWLTTQHGHVLNYQQLEKSHTVYTHIHAYRHPSGIRNFKSSQTISFPLIFSIYIVSFVRKVHLGQLAHKWPGLKTSVNNHHDAFKTHSLRPVAEVVWDALDHIPVEV